MPRISIYFVLILSVVLHFATFDAFATSSPIDIDPGEKPTCPIGTVAQLTDAVWYCCTNNGIQKRCDPPPRPAKCSPPGKISPSLSIRTLYGICAEGDCSGTGPPEDFVFEERVIVSYEICAPDANGGYSWQFYCSKLSIETNECKAVKLTCDSDVSGGHSSSSITVDKVVPLEPEEIDNCKGRQLPDH